MNLTKIIIAKKLSSELNTTDDISNNLLIHFSISKKIFLDQII